MRSSDRLCPFCGTAIGPAPARTSLVGRFSRAAVFAGLASCTSTSPKHVQQPPPPPADVVEELDTPPSDTTVGSVRGTVRDQSGRLVANFQLSLGDQTVMTDATGSFKFDNVPAGPQGIMMQHSNNPRHGPEYRPVEVVAGKVVRIVVTLPPPEPPDTGPCCKPYGAPPARRRVV